MLELYKYMENTHVENIFVKEFTQGLTQTGNTSDQSSQGQFTPLKLLLCSGDAPTRSLVSLLPAAHVA